MKILKVSIIIPVYNTGIYLKECLESVVQQELRDIEIIIVDDGSTDNSSAIIKEYQSQNHNIVLIKQKNRGQSVARNHALKIAKGEYIGFVDSDDVIERKMYSIMYETAIKYKLDIVEAQYTLVKSLEKIQRIGSPALYTSKEALKKLFTARVGTIWSCLFRAELFHQVTFPNRKIGEDLYVKAILFKKADRIGMISNKLYFYRQRSGSITHDVFDNRMFDILYTDYLMYAYLKKNDLESFGYYKDNLQDMCMQDLYTIIEKAVNNGYKMDKYLITDKHLCSFINYFLYLGLKKHCRSYFYKYLKLHYYIKKCKYSNDSKIVKPRKNTKEKYEIYYSTAMQWLVNKNEGKSISSYLEKRGCKTVAIYGAKDFGELVFQELKNSNIEVLYFIDRNVPSLAYSEECVPIIGLDLLYKEPPVDFIIVTPVFDYKNIQKSLLGISKHSFVLSLEHLLYNL